MNTSKGNTAVITIKTERDLRDANEVEVVFSQKGKVKLIKTGTSLLVDEDKIRIIVTKDDTELFEAGRYIPAEVNAYYDEGTKITSNVMYRVFNGTLKGELL